YRRLRDRVRESKELRHRVKILSPNDDELIGLIQTCSVFLSPRKYDYLGLAALEAMACGKPVVAYGTEEKREGLQPVVVCSDRIWEWRRAITNLMSDENL